MIGKHQYKLKSLSASEIPVQILPFTITQLYQQSSLLKPSFLTFDWGRRYIRNAANSDKATTKFYYILYQIFMSSGPILFSLL